MDAPRSPRSESLLLKRCDCVACLNCYACRGEYCSEGAKGEIYKYRIGGKGRDAPELKKQHVRRDKEAI